MTAGRLHWVRASAVPPTPCVELAHTPDGGVAVRRSEDPAGVLLCTREEFAAFLRGVENGEFRYLVC